MKTLLLLFILLSASFASADWQQWTADSFPLAPAPALGSNTDQQDLQTLLSLQQSRTQADCSLARRQQSPGFITFFGPYSQLFTQDELRRLTPLMDKVSKVVTRITETYKDQYLRPRPYTTHPEVRPCIPLPGGSKSYPSSHASISAAQSCILAQIFPDRADTLLKYGDYLGSLRMIVGVHNPSDVQAGKDLGFAICKALLADPNFRQLLP